MIAPAAGRQVWREVEEHLRPFLARRVRDPADVADLLQEIYLRVQSGLDDLRDTERFGPWVYRVARNALADHARARARHHPPGATETLPGEVATQPLEMDEDAAEREVATYLTTFVAALPSPYREAVFLSELQEMSHKDAASLLGISVAAMKSRVRRGRLHIQEMLRACCDIGLDARGRVVSCDRRPDGQIPDECCEELRKCSCWR